MDGCMDSQVKVAKRPFTY